MTPHSPRRRAALAGLVAGTAAAAAASVPAAAQPAAISSGADSVFIEDLTWTELRDRIRAGHTTLLVPIGGTEQSGPYMAVGKHNLRVRWLAQRIAQQLGNAVVAPVISYVPEGTTAPPSSHMRFPGTITLPEPAFIQLLVSAAESLQVHGVKHVAFLGDHGGYQRAVEQAVVQLNRRWAGRAHAFAPPAYYQASSTGFAAQLRRQGFTDDEIGTHAGLADAALQLAVAPQSVRGAALAHASRPGVADGTYGGDPRRATAALGQSGVDAIVRETVAAIRAATA